MNIWEKIRRVFSRKFCGIGIGLLISCLLAFIVYPVITKADTSVVYLRTTFPFAPVAEETQHDVQIPEMPFVDPEQRLVADLMKDDINVAYEKMKAEDKEQWQIVRMRVTGYCSCPKCCGKFSDGKTANCHRIRKGDVFVAADKYYPFGTEMIIPGYNKAKPVKVLDRGRVIKGNRLDLYFDTHQQAKKWGTKYLDVLVKTGQ